jgi:serine/threonine protein kinase
MLPAQMAIAPGAWLGSYQVIAEIGEGGMAKVYRARQASLNRDVAVKVLPDSLAAEPGFRERFQQEAVAVARLRHPNILAVHDFGQSEGTSYLVTEYVHGTTLDKLINGPMSLAEVVKRLTPIAAAIDHAHQHGVLHRDVKPSNIFVTEDGVPILGDFGLARMAQSDTHLTQTGTIIGTPAYMAPEQCEGLPASPATDVYALATIAYQMLTGDLPFSAPTPMRMLLTKMQEQPTVPRGVVPALPAAAIAALLKGLAVQPEDRFQTAAAFLDALRPPAPAQLSLRRRLPLLALVPAVLGGIFLAVGLVTLSRIVYVPMEAGTLASVDEAGIHLLHDKNAYPIDQSQFHPPLTLDPQLTDRKVEVYTDPASGSVIGLGLYDQNDANPVYYSTDAYDQYLSNSARQEGTAAREGIATVALMIIAGALFIGLDLFERRRHRARQHSPEEKV